MSEQPVDDARQLAIKRVAARRGLAVDAFAYVAVNVMILVIWFVIGRGFFWPIFPIAGWGMGLAIHAFTVYYGTEPSESEIEAEMRRISGAGQPPAAAM